MMLSHTWTANIQDLVETLTCRVRVLSLRHLQQGWLEQFGSPRRIVHTIERLIKSGLLQGDVWNVPQTPMTDRPLCRWTPGKAEPDLIRLEGIIRDRWDRPVQPTPVVAATHLAARLFGCTSGGLPPVNHRNHDLLLSEVYIRYRFQEPSLASRWLGEDAHELAERGVKNPDAFLCDEDGQVVRVIESAGRYSLKQLESFHRHCELAELAYELW